MPLPKLPPSANPYNMSLVFNVNQRPYFEKWYQDNKLEGESPEAYVMRFLKDSVMSTYVRDVVSQYHQDMNQEIDDIKAEF